MATVHFCAFLGSVPSDAASHTYSKRLCHTGGTVNCVVQITCGAVKISSCVRNSRGWILAQANNCRSFAIDVSKAVIPLQTPKEMWWTQTRALQRALLDPITHLPWQPFSLHSPQHSLRIFCSLHVHRTSSLEIGDNGSTLAQWHPFMSWLCPCSGFCTCRTLCTTLCGFPGAPFSKPSCQLRLGQFSYSFLSPTATA